MVPSTRSTSKSPDSVTHNTFLVPESSLLPTTSVGNYTNSHSNTPTFGISHTDANLDNSEGPKAVTNAIFNSDPRVETYPEPSAPKYEVRLFGLSQADTMLTLTISNFGSFDQLLCHPYSTNLQWAQVWVSSEADVARCLGLKGCLAPSGITLMRAPSTSPPQAQGISTVTTPELKTANASFELKTPPTPLPAPPAAFSSVYSADCTSSNPSPFDSGSSSIQNSGSALVCANGFNMTSLSDSLSSLTLDMNQRANSGLGYRHVDPQGPLPRNLYVMGLPLDMTQIQFKALFTPFGMVEHSTLLSQLDGMGRRRGFVLMSTHQEAVEAMRAMNCTWHAGFKLDVSWALIQREAKHFGPSNIMPNRVVHPPTVSIRRESMEECTVVVDNLDPTYFPDSASTRDIFNHFGPVSRTHILSSNPFKILIQFDHAVSATALVAANGLNLGGRPLVARRYVGAINCTLNSANAKMPQSASMTMPVARTAFDPFGQQLGPPQHQAQSHVQHSVPFPLNDLASPLSRMTTRRGSEPFYLSSLAQFEVFQPDPPQTLARPLLSYQARPQSQPVSNPKFQQSEQSDVLQVQKWQQFNPFTAFMEPTGEMNTHNRFGLGAKLTGNSSNGKSDGNGKSALTESKSFGTSISINTLKSDLFAPLPWHPIGDNKRTINEALKETNSLTTLQNGPHQQQDPLGLNKAAVKIGLDVQDENKRPVTNATGSMAPLGNTAVECGGLGVRGMQDRWQVSPDWWQVLFLSL
ncbi:hypothetical protein CNBI0300 [Cryptococcus gattii WM276]|uniref:RRM domain-containing protein n=1 Tax=Cryptococcus gattii serotype B (strain WM276 / ATCC MYA-4071) TaxID=367775 RepID=E6R593_CRYGW|nr:uncharacterized protein CGB_D0250W [Cryptococcus gattii WM276]ADV21458.1 hypothetical protein CNBI0300 [Cryptococcus gattii WM276]KJE03689.1 hypothetical protein I311_02452 [Cryptococcus gattii NT-10]